MGVIVELKKSQGGVVVFGGKRGLTPSITADSEGSIYVDGVLLTDAAKTAAESAKTAADDANKAAEDIKQIVGDINTALDEINGETI